MSFFFIQSTNKYLSLIDFFLISNKQNSENISKTTLQACLKKLFHYLDISTIKK